MADNAKQAHVCVCVCADVPQGQFNDCSPFSLRKLQTQTLFLSFSLTGSLSPQHCLIISLSDADIKHSLITEHHYNHRESQVYMYLCVSVWYVWGVGGGAECVWGGFGGRAGRLHRVRLYLCVRAPRQSCCTSI